MSHEAIGELELSARLRELAGSLAAPTGDELAEMAQRATRAHGRRTARAVRLRGPSRAVLAALAAAAIIVALIAANFLRQPTVAAAGVRFSHAKGYIVAHITDPQASAASLTKAFADEGLNIHLSLAPVSPSLVGTVLYVGEDGTSSGGGIDALQGGHCFTGGGGCPIGLRIPRDYRGEAYITLGRAAQGDESYASTTSIFAPGEPLHCSGLIGVRVAQIRGVLADRGYTAEWALYDGSDGGRISAAQAADDNVVDAEHMAPDRVLVSVSPTPLSQLDSETTSYLHRLESGC
jgi:hypothetical protein